MPADNAMHEPGSMISRRKLLVRAFASATTALCPLGSQPVFAAVQDVHFFKLGAFEITVISDGFLTLPPSFVLAAGGPKEAAELFASAGLPAPSEGIVAPVNVTLVKTPDALILIDAGGGGDFAPTLGKFSDAFDAAGLTPEAITHVIFTHAHADHLWGVIDPLDGGTHYPKARHLITAAEFDFWTTPDRDKSVPDLLVKMAIGTSRRLGILADRLEKPAPGSEIVPGVLLLDTHGHTPGYVSVMLQSGSEQLLIGADALTHPLVSFAKPGWRWGSDMDADKAIATRTRTLDMLATGKVALLGTHLPWPGVGRVEKKDTAYRFIAHPG
jgi:glyoxylase-like metal-dependent hydrolase (beta-lactamase superfamily II)